MRVTSKYDDVTGKVIEEVEYNDRNRPVRIKKYEWNENGTKAKQYNYLPNGKLYSGRGISTDIVGSSIQAYMNALNKIAYEEAEA